MKKKDFVVKSETYRNRRGKREYRNDKETRDFMRKLNGFFQSTVEVPRIRIGKRQEVETLINEEAWLFAKYLRSERTMWTPRIINLWAMLAFMQNLPSGQLSPTIIRSRPYQEVRSQALFL